MLFLLFSVSLCLLLLSIFAFYFYCWKYRFQLINRKIYNNYTICFVNFRLLPFFLFVLLLLVSLFSFVVVVVFVFNCWCSAVLALLILFFVLVYAYILNYKSLNYFNMYLDWIRLLQLPARWPPPRSIFRAYYTADTARAIQLLVQRFLLQPPSPSPSTVCLFCRLNGQTYTHT